MLTENLSTKGPRNTGELINEPIDSAHFYMEDTPLPERIADKKSKKSALLEVRFANKERISPNSIK